MMRTPPPANFTASAFGLTLLWLLCGASAGAGAPQTILLWPAGAPGSAGRSNEPETVRLTERGEHIVSNVHAPSLLRYAPRGKQPNGAAVVVMPGGGHAELWMDHEGYRVARFLADQGIAAFVLKYRLARQPGSNYTVEGDELADAQRAVQIVRSRAQEWRISPHRIGVMGFSAGGELALLAATRILEGEAASADAAARVSSRPDFQALLYPAIPADLRLSEVTPPAFLLCGADDRAGHFRRARRTLPGAAPRGSER